MQKRFLWLAAGMLVWATGALSPVRGATLTYPDKFEDVGGPDIKGSTKLSGDAKDPATVWTLTGAGSDVWGASDQFQYAYTTLPGDGGVTARILSQTGGDDNGWAKTGTMIRESTAADARMAYMPYCSTGIPDHTQDDAKGRNIEPGFRLDDGATPERARGNVTLSNHQMDSHEYYRRIEDGGGIWMRTQRQGQVFTHLVSDDGKLWYQVSQDQIAIDPKKALLAGMFACSHDATKTVTVTFDNVSVDNALIATGPANVQATPGTGAALITFGTVNNATGYNVYRLATGDKAWAKVNTDLVPNGWYIDPGLTNGTVYRYMVTAVLKDGTETDATNIALAESQVPIGPGLVAYDIGTQTPGSTKLDGTTLTLSGSGPDIWNALDGFRFLAMPVTGNYTLTAKILAKPAGGPGNDSDGWIKAGVMIRESLDPGSRNAMMIASSGNGIAFHWRRGGRLDNGQTQGDNPSEAEAGGTSDADTTYPQFLRVVRNGETVQGFQSSDGSTYTKVGDDINIPVFSPFTYAGLAVTAHNDRLQGIAQFDLSTFTIIPL